MHEDFRYEGTFDAVTGQPVQKGAVMKTNLAAPSHNVAAPLMVASAKAYTIMATPVEGWKDQLAAIEDETVRLETRRIMELRWKAQQHRKKVETLGKRTPAGDAAVAALAELARKL